MKRSTGVLLAAAGIWWCLAGTGTAGWEIQTRFTSTTGPRDPQVTYYQKNRVRVDMADSVQVMDLASRKIIWIHKKEKTYSVMTFDEFKQMVRENMKAASQAIEEMKKRGFSVPGAGPRAARKTEVHRLPGATIAGYPCDGYKVIENGRVTEEIWTTRKLDLSQEVDVARLREFEELSRESAGMMQDAGGMEPDPALKKVYESGYVMKTVYKETGDVDQVTRAERKTLPEDLFAEPKGYKKVPPAMGGMTKGAGMEESRPSPPTAKGAEEPREAASGETQEPAPEKKGEGLGGIREGAKEGIKKLFKW